MALKISIRIFSLLLLPLLFTAVSCNNPTEPPPNIDDKPIVKNTIVLKTEWQDLNRICLKFNKSVDDTTSLYKYTIKRKDVVGEEEVIAAFSIYGNDTLYIDGAVDTLETGKTFTYRITATDKEENLKDTSNTITTATLSPTSHDFEWTIDTLGMPGNSGLRDIWGTDENNVFAIGGITMPDGGSSVIKWDGEKWSSLPDPSPDWGPNGIFGFSKNDFWVVGSQTHGSAAHWNGTTWDKEYFWYPHQPNKDSIFGLNAVWGASPNDVWAVGGSGTIIHWDGIEWKKVESPTNKFLTDIWGSSPNNIYAVGFSLINQAEIIHYDGVKWYNITSELNTFTRGFRSIWIDKNNRAYSVGTSVIHYNGNRWNTLEINQTKFLTRIRGRNSTDVVAVGQRGRIHHYNGVGWKAYPELHENSGTLNELRGVIVFENQVIGIGLCNQGALVYKGRRN